MLIGEQLLASYMVRFVRNEAVIPKVNRLRITKSDSPIKNQSTNASANTFVDMLLTGAASLLENIREGSRFLVWIPRACVTNTVRFSGEVAVVEVMLAWVFFSMICCPLYSFTIAPLSCGELVRTVHTTL